jgi:hypothetical protein
MSPGYVRSVVLRAAGALVSVALWLGLIVVAISNLDTGLPAQEGGGWPFFAAALVLTVIVALALRRGSGGPGWGSFVLGLLIPEVAFFINRLVSTEVSAVFWIAAAVLILVPLPTRKAVAASG